MGCSRREPPRQFHAAGSSASATRCFVGGTLCAGGNLSWRWVIGSWVMSMQSKRVGLPQLQGGGGGRTGICVVWGSKNWARPRVSVRASRLPERPRMPSRPELDASDGAKRVDSACTHGSVMTAELHPHTLYVDAAVGSHSDGLHIDAANGGGGCRGGTPSGCSQDMAQHPARRTVQRTPTQCMHAVYGVMCRATSLRGTKTGADVRSYGVLYAARSVRECHSK